MDSMRLSDIVYTVTKESLPYEAVSGLPESVRYIDCSNGATGFIGGEIMDKYIIFDTTDLPTIKSKDSSAVDASAEFETMMKFLVVNFAVWDGNDNVTPVQTFVIYDSNPDVIIKILFNRKYHYGFLNGVSFGDVSAYGSIKHTRESYVTPGTVFTYAQTNSEHYNEPMFEDTDGMISPIYGDIYTVDTSTADISTIVIDTSFAPVSRINAGTEAFFMDAPIISSWGTKGSSTVVSVPYERDMNTTSQDASVVLFDTSVIDTTPVGKVTCNLRYAPGKNVVFDTSATSAFLDTPVVMSEFESQNTLTVIYNQNNTVGVYTHDVPSTPFNSAIMSSKAGSTYDAYLIMPGQTVMFDRDINLSFYSTSTVAYENPYPSIMSPNPVTGVLEKFVPYGFNVKKGVEYPYSSFRFDRTAMKVMMRS